MFTSFFFYRECANCYCQNANLEGKQQPQNPTHQKHTNANQNMSL